MQENYTSPQKQHCLHLQLLFLPKYEERHPANKSQQKDKTHSKSTNNKSNNTVFSSKIKVPKYKDNVVADVIAAPPGSKPNEPSRGRMGKLETLKLKDKSGDMNHIAASLGSEADNPGRSNLCILGVYVTLKVKDEFLDTNTIAAPIRSTVDNPRVNFGIVEVSETLDTKNDSIASGPNADDLEGGNMGVLEISGTLKLKDGSAHINTVTSPPASTSDDPMGDIDNVEISKTLEVMNKSTASAPNEDDPGSGKMDTLEISETLEYNLRGNIRVVEISKTVEVKNDNAASSLATPLTKPRLTSLDSKNKNRNQSAAKKTPAANSTSEAPNTSTSNKRRRKSWTSLKEIAKNNEKSRRLF